MACSMDPAKKRFEIKTLPPGRIAPPRETFLRSPRILESFLRLWNFHIPPLYVRDALRAVPEDRRDSR